MSGSQFPSYKDIRCIGFRAHPTPVLSHFNVLQLQRPTFLMTSHSQVPGRHELGGGGGGGNCSTQSPRASSYFGPVSPALNTPPLTLCSIKEIAFQILPIGSSISQTEKRILFPGQKSHLPWTAKGERGFLIEWLTPSSAGWSPFIHTCPLQQTTECTYGPS